MVKKLKRVGWPTGLEAISLPYVVRYRRSFDIGGENS